MARLEHGTSFRLIREHETFFLLLTFICCVQFFCAGGEDEERGKEDGQYHLSWRQPAAISNRLVESTYFFCFWLISLMKYKITLVNPKQGKLNIPSKYHTILLFLFIPPPPFLVLFFLILWTFSVVWWENFSRFHFFVVVDPTSNCFCLSFGDDLFHLYVCIFYNKHYYNVQWIIT